ncbi:helix-turn-helix domain-containing protein [Streptomyces pharetrae]
MRYAHGGGLTEERRILREKLRLEAAERLRHGDENTVIAHDLRVSVRSVQRWRMAWSRGGPRALASKGPASLPLLSDDLFAVLERELLKGPVAHGWPVLVQYLNGECSASTAEPASSCRTEPSMTASASWATSTRIP